MRTIVSNAHQSGSEEVLRERRNMLSHLALDVVFRVTGMLCGLIGPRFQLSPLKQGGMQKIEYMVWIQQQW